MNEDRPPARRAAAKPGRSPGATSPTTTAPPPGGQMQQGSVDIVVSEIVRGLYEGRFAPGQKLLESDLAQKFGVGRGSVREGLRRLEADGLVTAVLNRGASIRNFSRDGARDLLEVIDFLAGMAARLAAERIQKAEDAGPLRRSVEDIAASVEAGNFFALSRARYAFYSSVVGLAHNEELLRLLVRNEMAVIRTQFRAAFDLTYERQDLAAYKRVADQILARDAAGAERAIRQIIRRASSAVQALPDDHFAP